MSLMVGTVVLIVFMLAGFDGYETSEKSEFEITQQPANATIEDGQTAHLRCEFNKPVKCSWLRNSIVIKISDRYNYDDNRQGPKTNCSITIKNGNKIDYGLWICSFEVSVEQTNPIRSKPVYLNVTAIVEGINTERPRKTTTSTATPNSGESLGFSDKILWISLAFGLVGLSLLNTTIVICYRRRARSRRSSRKTTPSSSCPSSPIVINNRSDSMRKSTLGQPRDFHVALMTKENYVTPIDMARMMDMTDNEGQHENSEKKYGGGHHYQNIMLATVEPPIYEEILDN